MPPSTVGDAVTDRGPVGVLRVNTWRKWFGDVTGESSTPSEWPVSPAYKPQAKRQGRRGGAAGYRFVRYADDFVVVGEAVAGLNGRPPPYPLSHLAVVSRPFRALIL